MQKASKTYEIDYHGAKKLPGLPSQIKLSFLELVEYI